MEDRLAGLPPALARRCRRHPRPAADARGVRPRGDGARLLGARADLRRPGARRRTRPAGRTERGGPLDGVLDERRPRHGLHALRHRGLLADRRVLRRAGGAAAVRAPLGQLSGDRARDDAERPAQPGDAVPEPGAADDGRHARRRDGGHRRRGGGRRRLGDHRPAARDRNDVDAAALGLLTLAAAGSRTRCTASARSAASASTSSGRGCCSMRTGTWTTCSSAGSSGRQRSARTRSPTTSCSCRSLGSRSRSSRCSSRRCRASRTTARAWPPCGCARTG